MPLWKNTQHAFTAGQLDANVMGRRDMDRYFKGATLLKNFLVRRQGCISKRRGTDLAADLDGLLGTRHDGTPIAPGRVRLIPVVNGDEGRYVVLSGGIGFVASRGGVMMSDLSHRRRIPAYEAEDADGNPVAVTGRDARRSTETPVDVVRRLSAGVYAVTRHADTLDGSGNVTRSALQNAFDAAQDGDTVRLHANLALRSPVTVTPSGSWTDESGAAASVTYNDGTAGNEDRYRIVTGGQTYYSLESDPGGNRRSLTFNRRFVTAARSWTFSDGNAWSVDWSGNTWTFTREDGGATVTATAPGALDATSVAFTSGGEGVTATCAWSFSGTDCDPSKTYTMALERNRWRMRAADGSTEWAGTRFIPEYGVPPYAAEETVVSHVGTVTEAAKRVTLDLHGYKVTTLAQHGVRVPNASVSLTVDSSRLGAAFAVVGPSGGNTYGFYLASGAPGVPSGALRLKGEIEYDLLAGDGGHYLVAASDTSGVAVDAGSLTARGAGNVLIRIDGGPLAVNGGSLAHAAASGVNHLVQLLKNAGRALDASATVSGGSFSLAAATYDASYPQNSAFVFFNSSGTLEIDGGRFAFAAPRNFCYRAVRRGGPYWHDRRLRVQRGEFSQPAIRDGFDGVDAAVDEYSGDCGDETDPGAASVTFARLGLTAAASAWTFTDGGSLSLSWNAASGKWHLSGTDERGRAVSESADGNPADAEASFPGCGISASRSWTFSDGADHPIGYGNGRWHATASARNAAWPSDGGFYGVRAQGEADYSWDGAAASSRVPYRFAVPYADGDLAALCVRQSGDTLFIAHRDYPPAKVWFDAEGRAFFEELALDNTDHSPPAVESAAMSGNEPAEADWPSEFPRRNGQGGWVTSGVPAWVSALGSVEVNGVEKTAVEHLEDFVDACRALGTVTDAGFSGNATSSSSDGSGSYACSYSCTSVDTDLAAGKRTTTVSVLSFTKSVTVEKTTTFTDGLATGCDEDEVVTVGGASNSASAAAPLVARTVRYVATYVRDGRESRPSAPFAVDYAMPWASNAVVNITLSKGANPEEPEYYNVYKDNGNGYGLIASAGVDRVAGGVSGSVDTYPLFMPDNAAAAPALVCAADYEERKGWSVGDILRKMTSSGRDRFTSSPAGDVCLLNTASNAAGGIRIDFPDGGSRFDRVRVALDGRIYDAERDASYVVVSTCVVTCTATCLLADGTTADVSLTRDDPRYVSWGGSSGGMALGVYEDWLSLPRRDFAAPNGDTVHAWLYGKGGCADEFNAHLRTLDFDFREAFAAVAGFARVKSVRFTFSTSQYSNWYNNQQGCIHAVHFYRGADTGGGGAVQDDYVNPDMTVTPPDDSRDAHFSAAGDYPGCVGVYGQRLVFASTRESPSTVWMSRVADLYNFTAHESVREDDAMELTLAATEFPAINHLVAGRDLMLFGDGGEWLVAPVSGNALTYKTASAKLQSMVGSDRALQPLQLADETLFAERGGTCLRSINYNYSSDSYQSQDLSVAAQSLFRANPIVSMAYKQHPDSVVECVLADGRVATLVYMKEQEVAAWSVQELGGGWKARAVATPKCIVNGTTETMLLVEKGGAYQLWRVRDDDDAPAASAQVVLDGLHVEAADAAGEGESAVELGDGTYAVGFPVVSELVTVRPEPQNAQTVQMEVKNATEAEIRVTGATTFSVKPYGSPSGWAVASLPPARDGASVALRSGDCKKLLSGSNSRDGRLHLRHAAPWPITVLSVSTTYQVEYENRGAAQ